jgi:hypothetical protein
LGQSMLYRTSEVHRTELPSAKGYCHCQKGTQKGTSECEGNAGQLSARWNSTAERRTMGSQYVLQLRYKKGELWATCGNATRQVRTQPHHWKGIRCMRLGNRGWA